MDYNGNRYPQRPKKKKQSWLIPILLGAIIGILLVVVAILVVLDSGLIKNNQAVDDQGASDKGNMTDSPLEQSVVNVDINTQLTQVVEQVSPAVVGVTNIQLRSDFWEQSSGSEAGTGSGRSEEHT